MTWKEVVVADCDDVSQHFSGETEDKPGKTSNDIVGVPAEI
jgi:hypothetical protein